MDRQLINYLPPVLRNISDYIAITDAQQAEIEKAWNALTLILSNQFIDTATVNGVEMWEKELGITPSNSELLEVRKERIKSRWLNQDAYTLQNLIKKLDILCGEGNFTMDLHFDRYLIEIQTALDKLGQVAELKNLIHDVVPCNMVVMSENTISCTADNTLKIAGIVICTDYAEIKQGDD